MENYSITENKFHIDVDCKYDEKDNKIDVYTSVNWREKDRALYEFKEAVINAFCYENDLILVRAWCDISGYDYWLNDEEENYISINVNLKRPVDQYSQDEIKGIAKLINEWDNYFIRLFN